MLKRNLCEGFIFFILLPCKSQSTAAKLVLLYSGVWRRAQFRHERATDHYQHLFEESWAISDLCHWPTGVMFVTWAWCKNALPRTSLCSEIRWRPRLNTGFNPTANWVSILISYWLLLLHLLFYKSATSNPPPQSSAPSTFPVPA